MKIITRAQANIVSKCWEHNLYLSNLRRDDRSCSSIIFGMIDCQWCEVRTYSSEDWNALENENDL